MALTRSQNMARIKGKNTSPELAVRKGLSARGLRYRLQYRTPGGRADLAMPAKRFALFIDGCFWHGCPEHYVRPRSREEFWTAKLQENVARDRRQVAALAEAGWTVVRIWEHEVVEAPSVVVDKVLTALKESASSLNAARVVRVELIDATTDLERRHLESLTDPSACTHEERFRMTRKVGRVVHQ